MMILIVLDLLLSFFKLERNSFFISFFFFSFLIYIIIAVDAASGGGCEALASALDRLLLISFLFQTIK
jgi:hypothetical protein